MKKPITARTDTRNMVTLTMPREDAGALLHIIRHPQVAKRWCITCPEIDAALTPLYPDAQTDHQEPL